MSTVELQTPTVGAAGRPDVSCRRSECDHSALLPDRDRCVVRAGFDPRDLWLDPGTVHCVHGDGVLADGSAPAVLPHRWTVGPSDLPLMGSFRDPGVYWRQADPSRTSRKQPSLY